MSGPLFPSSSRGGGRYAREWRHWRLLRRQAGSLEVGASTSNLKPAHLMNVRFDGRVGVSERPFPDSLRRRRTSPTTSRRVTSCCADETSRTRALRNPAVHNPGVLEDALADAFPWLEFLPVADRKLFVDESSRVTVAAASIDSDEPLNQLVREWRDTAEVPSDPKLARRLGGRFRLQAIASGRRPPDCCRSDASESPHRPQREAGTFATARTTQSTSGIRCAPQLRRMLASCGTRSPPTRGTARIGCIASKAVSAVAW